MSSCQSLGWLLRVPLLPLPKAKGRKAWPLTSLSKRLNVLTVSCLLWTAWGPGALRAEPLGLKPCGSAFMHLLQKALFLLGKGHSHPLPHCWIRLRNGQVGLLHFYGESNSAFG